MKKILANILLVFYLALSSSASINMHYCGGELESIQINSEPLSCCCGTETSSTCCDDEVLNLELEIDQYTVHSISFPENVFVNAEIIFGIDILKETNIEEYIVETYIEPPPKPEAIWLLICNFTYYG